jgi:signal transduction histidine kinase
MIPSLSFDCDVAVKGNSDQFVSALAHEIRNPLTNIKLSVEMLNSVIKDNDLKVYIDIIVRSSKKIDNLIKELLTIQKLNEIQAEKHSIHQLLEEVIEIAEDRIRLKNIVVRKNFAAQDCEIILDKPKMKIALANIVINAIDAMEPEKGELSLVTNLVGGKYVLLIKDNGCGINKENLKNIFKPYFTNKPGGLGLGLSTTYDILRLNNVNVNVESEEGKGTSFSLLFDKKNNPEFFPAKSHPISA